MFPLYFFSLVLVGVTVKRLRCYTSRADYLRGSSEVTEAGHPAAIHRGQQGRGLNCFQPLGRTPKQLDCGIAVPSSACDLAGSRIRLDKGTGPTIDDNGLAMEERRCRGMDLAHQVCRRNH